MERMSSALMASTNAKPASERLKYAPRVPNLASLDSPLLVTPLRNAPPACVELDLSMHATLRNRRNGLTSLYQDEAVGETGELGRALNLDSVTWKSAAVRDVPLLFQPLRSPLSGPRHRSGPGRKIAPSADPAVRQGRLVSASADAVIEKIERRFDNDPVRIRFRRSAPAPAASATRLAVESGPMSLSEQLSKCAPKLRPPRPLSRPRRQALYGPVITNDLLGC